MASPDAIYHPSIILEISCSLHQSLLAAKIFTENFSSSISVMLYIIRFAQVIWWRISILMTLIPLTIMVTHCTTLSHVVHLQTCFPEISSKFPRHPTYRFMITRKVFKVIVYLCARHTYTCPIFNAQPTLCATWQLHISRGTLINLVKI